MERQKKGLSPIRDLITDHDLFSRFQHAWDRDGNSRSPSPRFPISKYRGHSPSQSTQRSPTPHRYVRRKRISVDNFTPLHRKARRYTRIQRSPSVNTLQKLGIDPLAGEDFTGDHPQKPLLFNYVPRNCIVEENKPIVQKKAPKRPSQALKSQLVKSDADLTDLPNVGVHPAWIAKPSAKPEPVPILSNVKQVYIQEELPVKKDVNVLYDPFEDTFGNKQQLWTLEKITLEKCEEKITQEIPVEEIKSTQKSQKRKARQTRKKKLRALEKEAREKQEETRKQMELELDEITKAREANEREFQETINAMRKEKRLRAEAEEFDTPMESLHVEREYSKTEEKRRRELLKRREVEREADAERQRHCMSLHESLKAEVNKMAELTRREELRIQALRKLELERERERERILAEKKKLHEIQMKKKEEAETAKALKEQRIAERKAEQERFRQRMALHDQAHDAQLKEEWERREANKLKRVKKQELKLQKQNEHERFVEELKALGWTPKEPQRIKKSSKKAKKTKKKKITPSVVDKIELDEVTDDLDTCEHADKSEDIEWPKQPFVSYSSPMEAYASPQTIYRVLSPDDKIIYQEIEYKNSRDECLKADIDKVKVDTNTEECTQIDEEKKDCEEVKDGLETVSEIDEAPEMVTSINESPTRDKQQAMDPPGTHVTDELCQINQSSIENSSLLQNDSNEDVVVDDVSISNATPTSPKIVEAAVSGEASSYGTRESLIEDETTTPKHVSEVQDSTDEPRSSRFIESSCVPKQAVLLLDSSSNNETNHSAQRPDSLSRSNSTLQEDMKDVEKHELDSARHSERIEDMGKHVAQNPDSLSGCNSTLREDMKGVEKHEHDSGRHSERIEDMRQESAHDTRKALVDDGIAAPKMISEAQDNIEEPQSSSVIESPNILKEANFHPDSRSSNVAEDFTQNLDTLPGSNRVLQEDMKNMEKQESDSSKDSERKEDLETQASEPLRRTISSSKIREEISEDPIEEVNLEQRAKRKKKRRKKQSTKSSRDNRDSPEESTNVILEDSINHETTASEKFSESPDKSEDHPSAASNESASIVSKESICLTDATPNSEKIFPEESANIVLEDSINHETAALKKLSESLEKSEGHQSPASNESASNVSHESIYLPDATLKSERILPGNLIQKSNNALTSDSPSKDNTDDSPICRDDLPAALDEMDRHTTSEDESEKINADLNCNKDDPISPKLEKDMAVFVGSTTNLERDGTVLDKAKEVCDSELTENSQAVREDLQERKSLTDPEPEQALLPVEVAQQHDENLSHNEEKDEKRDQEKESSSYVVTECVEVEKSEGKSNSMTIEVETAVASSVEDSSSSLTLDMTDTNKDDQVPVEGKQLHRNTKLREGEPELNSTEHAHDLVEASEITDSAESSTEIKSASAMKLTSKTIDNSLMKLKTIRRKKLRKRNTSQKPESSAEKIISEKKVESICEPPLQLKSIKRKKMRLGKPLGKPSEAKLGMRQNKVETTQLISTYTKSPTLIESTEKIKQSRRTKHERTSDSQLSSTTKSTIRSEKQISKHEVEIDGGECEIPTLIEPSTVVSESQPSSATRATIVNEKQISKNEVKNDEGEVEESHVFEISFSELQSTSKRKQNGIREINHQANLNKTSELRMVDLINAPIEAEISAGELNLALKGNDSQRKHFEELVEESVRGEVDSLGTIPSKRISRKKLEVDGAKKKRFRKKKRETPSMEFEITMAELDAFQEQGMLGNVECVEDFSLAFLKQAQKEIKDNDLNALQKKELAKVKKMDRSDTKSNQKQQNISMKRGRGAERKDEKEMKKNRRKDSKGKSRGIIEKTDEKRAKQPKKSQKKDMTQKNFREAKKKHGLISIKLSDPKAVEDTKIKEKEKYSAYDRTKVKFVDPPSSSEIPIQTFEKKVSAQERRENIRSVWDRLTTNAKGKSKFNQDTYRYPYKIVHGATGDSDEDMVMTRDELFDLALKAAYGREAPHGTTFLLSKSGFQKLEDPVEFVSIDDRKIDPKHQKTKQDIKMALHLYQSKPSATLESDIVANLEMLEIFDPFLADKMKYHHPELGEIKDKVYEREKEPTEWNMWQLCSWLRKEKFSKWVVKKFEVNDINGKTIHWFTKNRQDMAEQLDLDEEICDEICDEIIYITKERRRRARRFRRSPKIVDFIRRTLPQLSQNRVLHYSRTLGENSVWQIEDLTKQFVWDKLDEIKASHLIPLIQAAIKKVDDTPEELEFKLKHLRIHDEEDIDNVSVATGQSMSPGMLVSRRLLAEQWIANKFPDIWNKYPERGGKLGYVIVELKDTEQISKKQYRALNVLRYGGAIGAHYAPLSEYQTGQKGHMKAESDRSLKKLGLLKEDKSFDEDELLLQSNNAMNSLGLSDLDMVTHGGANLLSFDEEEEDLKVEIDERFLGDSISLQCPKQVRFAEHESKV